jgi:phosphate-selective porin OprO and OprP
MSLSYILTGENRQYDRQAGRFKGVVPFENFFRVRTEDGSIRTGIGAWEMAYRISYLNLTDVDVRGGRVVDHTIGLNWYMCPNARLMFDLIHSETTARAAFDRGIVDIFATRMQLNF